MNTALIFSIVPHLLPAFMIGFVSLLGLILQKKQGSDVITGTVKATVGVLVLFAGVDVLSNTITPIAQLFSNVFPGSGTAIAADWTKFLADYGVAVVLIMVFGFFVNLLIARITPFKYVFLTGHILFWNAFMVTAALSDTGKITGIPLIIVGSIVLGLISTFLPALISKFVFSLTGTKDFTIGHTTTIHSFLGAWVGKVFGDKSKSLEDIKLPKSLGFLKSMTVSTSIIMFLIYLVMGFVAKPGFAATTFAGGSQTFWYFWIIFQGLMFAAGLAILLTGVRMMLGEIIPAFHGIAEKIVPEAVPALDCPMIFPYGENSLAIGFPIAMIFSLITLVIFGLAGYKYLLLPLVTAAFFDVGPGVILANHTGGRRGALIYAALGGVLLIVLEALSLPFVIHTGAGFLTLFGGNDFSLIAIVVGGISRLLGL